MKDCGPEHSGLTWTPASRCVHCGHRVPDQDTVKPRATRSMPVWYWPYELLARFVARHPVREMEPRDG